ncbi:MAG TPA: hypothetical protein ENN57_01660 [Chloroflexi bacterium]|nr:hypothetical protein [Chloroflexota bacterium]
MKSVGQAYMEYQEACKELDDKAGEYWNVTWMAEGLPVVLPKKPLSIGARKELFKLARAVERKLQLLMIELSRA